MLRVGYELCGSSKDFFIYFTLHDHKYIVKISPQSSRCLQSVIALRVIKEHLYSGIRTVEVDNIAAETAVSLISQHPDYATLAARIAISNLHKETEKTFSSKMLLIDIDTTVLDQSKDLLQPVAHFRGDGTTVRSEKSIHTGTFAYNCREVLQDYSSQRGQSGFGNRLSQGFQL